MTSVIRELNLLPIPEQIANELGLHSGVSVEVTRTAEGFEVKTTRPGMRRGSDGVWRAHDERMAILEGLHGQGQRFIAGAGSQVDALLRDREEDASLDREDDIA